MISLRHRRCSAARSPSSAAAVSMTSITCWRRCSFPLGSEHGAIIRLPNGLYDEVELEVPEDWKRALHDLAAAMSRRARRSQAP